MRLTCALVLLLLFACASCARPFWASADTPALSGEKAMEHVRAQVAFGPRPPGSEALQKCREYIEQQLRSYGYTVEEDAFNAETPYGTKRMVNLIARKGAGSKGVIALASHYDTKYMEGIRFVGANDGGASTGLLLELARVLAASKDGADYWCLFLDGEEAWVEWSAFDSTYGSRHLAKRWQQEGVAGKIHAFVLLDMIGDKDLDLWRDTNSTPWLMDLVWQTAQKIGLGSILGAQRGGIEDDHLPFANIGIPVVDIIDLNYGPNNSFHHTDQDTLDKVSPQSMEKVGKLVLAVLPLIQEREAASRSRPPGWDLPLCAGWGFDGRRLDLFFEVALLVTAEADCPGSLRRFQLRVRSVANRTGFRDRLVPQDEIAGGIVGASVECLSAPRFPLDDFAAAILAARHPCSFELQYTCISDSRCMPCIPRSGRA